MAVFEMVCPRAIPPGSRANRKGRGQDGTFSDIFRVRAMTCCRPAEGAALTSLPQLPRFALDRRHASSHLLLGRNWVPLSFPAIAGIRSTGFGDVWYAVLVSRRPICVADAHQRKGLPPATRSGPIPQGVPGADGITLRDVCRNSVASIPEAAPRQLRALREGR